MGDMAKAADEAWARKIERAHKFAFIELDRKRDEEELRRLRAEIRTNRLLAWLTRK